MNKNDKANTNKNKKVESKNSDTPSLSDMKNYFRKMPFEKFQSYLNRFMEEEDVEGLHFFFYYIVLFRDLKNIQTYLNHESISIEVLEKLFMFTYGHCTIHGYSTENILDNILSFFSNERLLKLILESKFIKRDKFFRFFVLARFDINTLDKYFKKQENITDIISAFYRLPENVMKSIIVRNHRLFEYMMMLLVDKQLTNEARIFLKKYKTITDQFATMNNVIMKYRTKVNLDKEEKLPFKQRNMKRISYLVNTIRSMNDWEMAVDYFAEEHVFVDEYERQVIYALVSDPLLKNTFQKSNVPNTYRAY